MESFLQITSVACSMSYSFRQQLYKHYIHHLIPKTAWWILTKLYGKHQYTVQLCISVSIMVVLPFLKKVFQNLLHQFLPNGLIDFDEQYGGNSVICIFVELYNSLINNAKSSFVLFRKAGVSIN